MPRFSRMYRAKTVLRAYVLPRQRITNGAPQLAQFAVDAIRLQIERQEFHG